MAQTPRFTKLEVARARGVTTRTVDAWIKRGLLDRPIKFGQKTQSRVRFTAEQLEVLDEKLALLGHPAPAQHQAG